VSKFFERPFEENELELIDEGRYSLFIAEDKLQGCPNVKVTIGNEEITSTLDTGCELCLMSQDLYNKLKGNGMKNLELPVQNMSLVSAFSDKARKVRTQAMLTLKIGEETVDQIFLIAPRLITQVLIGVDFCVRNKVIISFPDNCFTMKVKNELTKHMFLQGSEDLASSLGDSATNYNNKGDVKLTSVAFLHSTEKERLITEDAINYCI
jgi:hypothetical protein